MKKQTDQNFCEKDLDCLPKETFTNGEELLLAKSPVFKRRYIHDGGLMLGCKYGCQFCYYRWINISQDYIGTGRLKTIATPHQMIKFLKNSKLFLPQDVLILGANGDISMYPHATLEFLELMKQDKHFKDNLVLGLHRAPATNHILQAMKNHSQNFRFGTTITPQSYELGWTKIKDEDQLEGIKKIIGSGADPDHISVEVGPLNSENIEKGIKILHQLNQIGVKNLMVRGIAFGSFGVDRDREFIKMKELGFIDPVEFNPNEQHDYYVVKNFLTPKAYQWLQEQTPNLIIHRHTYTFYRDIWKVPIAGNRSNKVRFSRPAIHPIEYVETIIKKYNLHPVKIIKNSDHYLIELPIDQTATEDLAMTIGAQLESAVLFNNYRRTTSLDDVKFYQQNNLFALDPFIK